MQPFNKQQLLSALKVSALLFAFILILSACKKSDTVVLSSGTYTGTYLWGNGGITYNHGKLGATLILANNTYSSRCYSTDPNVNSVALVSIGTYKLKTDSIIFTPNMIAPGTQQTSTQNLTGTYQYHFEGDSLIVTYSYSSGSMYVFNQYRLKRN